MIGRAVALLALLTLAGCTTVFRQPVNASPGLRWWLFSNYGRSQICPELRRQGVPLRPAPRAPSVGRFFPQRCRVTLDERHHLVTVDVGGSGYGYAPVSGRVGFELDASLRYRMDFQITDHGTYIWGVPVAAQSRPRVHVTSVENGLAGMATPVGLDIVAEQLVRTELYRGFTVLHHERAHEFSLGIVRPPLRPYTPFTLRDGARFVFANETISVHAGQRDYLGPFHVTEPGQRLSLRFSPASAPAEALIVTRSAGDSWRLGYQQGHLGPPPGPILAGTPMQPGRSTVREFRLPPGAYYVVVDNTGQAGNVMPTGSVVVSYVAQLLD